MKQFYCFSALAIILSLASHAFAQTAGIGEVVAIEYKAKRIEDNNASIRRYKAEIADGETLWHAKIEKLQGELAALYKEQTDLINDMKVGAKCSLCGKYKSQFEKEGVDFQKHLGEVKGYAVPATTEELEATRKRFTEKIAYKKVQIKNAEAGDAAVSTKQNKITDLAKENSSLCTEIWLCVNEVETGILRHGL